MKKIWIAAAVSGAVLVAACSRPPATASNEENRSSTPATGAPPAAVAPTNTAFMPATQTPPATAETRTTGDLAVPPASTPTTTAAPQDTTATVKRIGVDETKQLVDSGAVTVIDVRDAAAYAAGHIPGALHMPLQRLQSEPGAVPKGKPVVAYCT